MLLKVIRQQVKDLTGGGVEYSFEAIGLKQTAEQAFYMLTKGGTATVIGMIPVGTKIELHGPDFLQEKNPGFKYGLEPFSCRHATLR